MLIENLAFAITDFAKPRPVEYSGETGMAIWRTSRR